jgi:DNA-binding transcriptional MerR regulator
MDVDLPDKQYLKIGEVSRLTSLNSSVLRFWETEFEQLQPSKSRTGQRLYTRNDLAVIFQIKRLLYEEKLTIAGARKKISMTSAGERLVGKVGDRELNRKLLAEVLEELKQIRDSL